MTFDVSEHGLDFRALATDGTVLDEGRIAARSR